MSVTMYHPIPDLNHLTRSSAKLKCIDPLLIYVHIIVWNWFHDLQCHKNYFSHFTSVKEFYTYKRRCPLSSAPLWQQLSKTQFVRVEPLPMISEVIIEKSWGSAWDQDLKSLSVPFTFIFLPSLNGQNPIPPSVIPLSLWQGESKYYSTATLTY